MADGPIVQRVAYAQGDVGGEMAFNIYVVNGTPGAAVSFYVTNPDPDGNIELPPTTVTGSPMIAGVQVPVPAHYTTEIVYTYDPRGTAVAPDLEVSMRVYYVSEPVAEEGPKQQVIEEEPTLTLNVSLANPMIMNLGQVVASVESSPVLNTLELVIHNPQDNPVIEVENVDGLTPDDPLPPINQPWAGPRLDRLYIYFPYGSGAGQLTTNELAAGITLSPAPDNTKWDVAKQSDATIGVNWILFPKTQAVLEKNESVRFILSGILTYNPPGSLTHLNLKKAITGYETQVDKATDLLLIEGEPKILTFNAEPHDDVIAGQYVDLSWTTWNAKYCTLDNTIGLEANRQSYPQRVVASKVFKLTATSAREKSTSTFAPVNVMPARIDSFSAVPPDGTRIGEPVKLTWSTKSAVSLDISPGVGFVCIDAAGCDVGERTVYPTTRTLYTLTATGGPTPVQKSLTVFPMPTGWKKVTSDAPWDTRDRPVLLSFQEMLWFMGGGTTTLNNPVFNSLDGATWNTVLTTAPWTKRTYAGGAVFPPSSPRMLFLGGESGTTYFNDIWASTDGQMWTQVSDGAPWGKRSKFGCVIFRNKLWVFGGFNGTSGLNDIWSSDDGVTWTQAPKSANWSPRWAFATVVFNDQLWILGGQIGTGTYSLTNDVWRSSDGVNWEQITPPPWTSRSLACAEAFGAYLYMFDGFNGTSATDELWRMNIRVEAGKEYFDWTSMPTPKMNETAAMASVKFFGGAWMAGGWSTTNDVRGPNRTVWLYAPGTT